MLKRIKNKYYGCKRSGSSSSTTERLMNEDGVETLDLRLKGLEEIWFYYYYYIIIIIS